MIYTLTRQRPPGWTGHAGRVTERCCRGRLAGAAGDPIAFVCGPTAFVESDRRGTVRLGYPAQRVKTERFGGVGGHLMDALDGNAIGGLLHEVFGTEMTAATGHLRGLRRDRAGRRARGLPGRARARWSVPTCSAVLMVIVTRAPGELRRPAAAWPAWADRQAIMPRRAIRLRRVPRP